MGAESGDLGPAELRHLEQVPVGGVPDRLGHVPEIKAVVDERVVLPDCDRQEDPDPTARSNCDDHCGPKREHAPRGARTPSADGLGCGPH